MKFKKFIVYVNVMLIHVNNIEKKNFFKLKFMLIFHLFFVCDQRARGNRAAVRGVAPTEAGGVERVLCRGPAAGGGPGRGEVIG